MQGREEKRGALSERSALRPLRLSATRLCDRTRPTAAVDRVCVCVCSHEKAMEVKACVFLFLFFKDVIEGLSL